MDKVDGNFVCSAADMCNRCLNLISPYAVDPKSDIESVVTMKLLKICLNIGVCIGLSWLRLTTQTNRIQFVRFGPVISILTLIFGCYGVYNMESVKLMTRFAFVFSNKMARKIMLSIDLVVRYILVFGVVFGILFNFFTFRYLLGRMKLALHKLEQLKEYRNQLKSIRHNSNKKEKDHKLRFYLMVVILITYYAIRVIYVGFNIVCISWPTSHKSLANLAGKQVLIAFGLFSLIMLLALTGVIAKMFIDVNRHLRILRNDMKRVNINETGPIRRERYFYR